MTIYGFQLVFRANLMTWWDFNAIFFQKVKCESTAYSHRHRNALVSFKLHYYAISTALSFYLNFASYRFSVVELLLPLPDGLLDWKWVSYYTIFHLKLEWILYIKQQLKMQIPLGLQFDNKFELLYSHEKFTVLGNVQVYSSTKHNGLTPIRSPMKRFIPIVEWKLILNGALVN